MCIRERERSVCVYVGMANPQRGGGGKCVYERERVCVCVGVCMCVVHRGKLEREDIVNIIVWVYQ